MKPQDHPFQRAKPAGFRNIVEVHNTHFGKPSRTIFFLFQKSWMFKTCTGSQEKQQFWQTEAIFRHTKPYAHPVFQRIQ